MKKVASSQRHTLEKDEQIAEGNSASLINNFVFNLKDYLSKPLALNLKKTSEDHVVEKIIKKFSNDNVKYYIQHTKSSNIFTIKQDKKQQEKDQLSKTILNINSKIAKSSGYKAN